MLIRNKFLVRGVAYQVVEIGSSVDPISDDRVPQLERDVILFKELGVNTLHVCTFDDAGIANTLLPLTGTSLNRPY
jgi:hypothetical protein